MSFLRFPIPSRYSFLYRLLGLVMTRAWLMKRRAISIQDAVLIAGSFPHTAPHTHTHTQE